MSEPHSHLPYAPDGSGFYSDNVLGVFDVNMKCLPLLLESIDEIVNRDGKPNVFVIADFGTADGGASMPLFYECVKHIKKICGKEQPVHVIYEDQATNDFKSLFLMLNGLIPGPKSFLTDFQNTFISATGTSFYRQCLPPESYHLGFSATCMHWLRKKPCNLTNGVHHTHATVESEKTVFAQAAALDWEEILIQRSSEMKKGGRFVMAQFAIDADGYYLGNTSNVKNSMFHTMKEIMEEMVKSGRITQEEYHDTTIANYYRTVEEYKEPFLNESSKVRKAGLELISIQTKRSPCPVIKKWRENGGNPVKHAKELISNMRVWSNTSYYSGLSTSRPEQERRDIVDEFYQAYEKRIAENPSEHGMDYVHAYMVIRKN